MIVSSVAVENRDPYPPTSRYKSSKYYQRTIPGIGRFIESESWTPPDLKPEVTDLFTKVQPGEEGRLDLVALRVYNLSALWWVIAYVNNIIDPFNVAVDTVLRYPPFDKVATRVLT